MLIKFVDKKLYRINKSLRLHMQLIVFRCSAEDGQKNLQYTYTVLAAVFPDKPWVNQLLP